MCDELPAIERPNGKLYRPRALMAEPVANEDEVTVGIVVFGTHDQVTAQPLADELAASEVDRGFVAVDPEQVWWRDGFTGGTRTYIWDEVKGRAGVWFREIVERTVSHAAS